MRVQKNWSLILVALSLFALGACAKEASTKPNFIFKKAPSKDVVAKFMGKNITEGELVAGVENDIFEKEMEIYELKMGKIKSMVLERLINNHPKKAKLTNDEFLDKEIVSKISISKSDIDAFVKERKIPAQHLNEQMNARIKKFLTAEKKKDAIENWISAQTSSKPVEVYLTKPNRPVFDVKTEGAPWAGGADAKVTVVEFSDFQCPFCAKGATLVTDLKKKYGKKIKVVFKNFPLPFHNHAQAAAEASMCVFEQDQAKFWKMHDQMFADQTKLAKADLVKTAKGLGMDMAKFNNCLDKNQYAARVKQDMEDGKAAGVKSTPTFFVNGKVINGAQDIEVFSELIDEELAR